MWSMEGSLLYQNTRLMKLCVFHFSNLFWRIIWKHLFDTCNTALKNNPSTRNVSFTAPHARNTQARVKYGTHQSCTFDMYPFCITNGQKWRYSIQCNQETFRACTGTLSRTFWAYVIEKVILHNRIWAPHHAASHAKSVPLQFRPVLSEYLRFALVSNLQPHTVLSKEHTS